MLRVDGIWIYVDEYLRALQLMEQIGGRFESALSIAWQHADFNNRRRLEGAFGDLLAKYHKLCR